MGRVSIEIVPTNPEKLFSRVNYIKLNFPQISLLNIPDIPKYCSIRSWEASFGVMNTSAFNVIPHLRSIDFAPNDVSISEELQKNNISEILVVSGDPPDNFTEKRYNTTPFDILKCLRGSCPGVKVYAAFDPYRSNMRTEMKYLEQKIRAGFDGYFTQPLFDLNLLRYYDELLCDQTVFWGLSPVVSDASRSYWEQKNNVVFPRSFDATLDWNIRFGKDFLSYIKLSEQRNCYIMPIRVSLEDYFPKLFN